MWQALYDGPWNQPLAGWTLTALTVVWLARQERSWLRTVLLVFALQLCIDNGLTGAWNPLPPTSPLGQPLAILFVILGDWRYFLMTERALATDGPTWRPWALSLGLALLVPVAQAVALQVAPAQFPTLRHTFLAYEALFAGLAVVLRLVVWPRRLAGATPDVRAWVLRLTDFEIAQYVLWASADVVILSGSDFGYALRLVPNTLYYGVFLAFAAWRAPRLAR